MNLDRTRTHDEIEQFSSGTDPELARALRRARYAEEVIDRIRRNPSDAALVLEALRDYDLKQL
jgi:hypothetical protein